MIAECELLEASIDVEKLSFDEIMGILRGYIGGLLSDGAAISRLGVGTDVLLDSRGLLDRVARRRDPDPDACTADRVAGWKLHDASVGGDERFAALLVLCTHDRDSAEFDTFGPEAMVESIMASVCALGEGHGLDFVDHARRSAPGQRCRRAALP